MHRLEKTSHRLVALGEAEQNILNWYLLSEGGQEERSIIHILSVVNESNSVEVSESHYESSTDWTDSTCNNVVSSDTLAGYAINYVRISK